MTEDIIIFDVICLFANVPVVGTLTLPNSSSMKTWDSSTTSSLMLHHPVLRTNGGALSSIVTSGCQLLPEGL